jgi:ABC-2 type transport system permease protein
LVKGRTSTISPQKFSTAPGNCFNSGPSTHCVNFAQGILYRGAGLEIVWRSFAAITVIGLIFFAIALLRFRRTVAIT